jgi:hypothetical protein
MRRVAVGCVRRGCGARAVDFSDTRLERGLDVSIVAEMLWSFSLGIVRSVEARG